MKIFLVLFFIIISFSRAQNCCDAQTDALLNCDGIGCFIPDCSNSCDWIPLQCWASTGACWCVDNFGNEIQGSFTSPGANPPVCQDNNCEPGFQLIGDRCYSENDISILQNMIDNSYQSSIDLNCESDIYCGSPNPYMDNPESWFSNVYDNESIQSKANGNGIVEPLELGIQEWKNGRLVSFMCGSYIYCQLSGPIPEQINQLDSLDTFRVEGNYLSGFIPSTLCDLEINFSDYILFDINHNLFCPYYPSCIDEINGWYQNTSSCVNLGDINYDFVIDILDIILIVSLIISGEQIEYQLRVLSDLNQDLDIDILDIVYLVDTILNY